MKKKITLNSKDLTKIIRESIVKNYRRLNEGMTNDNPAYDKWYYLVDNIGAETMIDNIFNYLDVNTLEDIIRYFEQDGYFEGSGFDEDNEDLYESRKRKLNEDEEMGEYGYDDLCDFLENNKWYISEGCGYIGRNKERGASFIIKPRTKKSVDFDTIVNGIREMFGNDVIEAASVPFRNSIDGYLHRVTILNI